MWSERGVKNASRDTTDPSGATTAGNVMEPEPFRVEIRPERGCVRVLPVGEVDLGTAPVLADCLRELIDVGFERIRLDLSRLSFLDCASLRAWWGPGHALRRPERDWMCCTRAGRSHGSWRSTLPTRRQRWDGQRGQ